MTPHMMAVSAVLNPPTFIQFSQNNDEIDGN
jgi:hypothetical protein